MITFRRTLSLLFALAIAGATGESWAESTNLNLKLPDDVFAHPSSLKLPDDVFAHPPGEDTVDVLLFGGERVAVVRVHIKVDGKAYKTAWGDLVIRLLAYLDRNDDGVLTKDEANAAPWTNLLQPPFNGNPLNLQGVPTAIDSSPADGKVSYDELVAYLKKSQKYEPLGEQSGPPPDPRFEAVFQQIDHDGDKALATAELAETDGLVARLDRDEDETISLDEFTPDRSPLTDRFGRGNGNGAALDAEKSPALLLATPDQLASAAARILRVHGGKGKTVGPDPLWADPLKFAAADANGDGALNLDELKRYLADPMVHLELVVTLGGAMPNPGATGRIEKAKARDGSTPPEILTTRTPGDGSLVIDYAGTEIELRAGDSRNNFGNFLDQQFEQADGDKDKAISASEARGNFFLQRIFLVADRNGDHKMTLPELKAFVALNTAALDAKMQLTVSDRGVAIYDTLDNDKDNRLSIRELRGASTKLAPLDRDHDGRIALTELPRRSQLNFGRGPAPNRNLNVVILNRRNNNQPRATGLPSWFVGMDRNGDGDVSPREFLGRSDQFREFDADGDGLIDAGEAARVP